MKLKNRILIFTIIFSLFGSTCVYAIEDESIEPSVIIDGRFDDWEGKPILIDVEGDNKELDKNQDLKEIRYISDKNFLYIYLERVESGQSWDIRVPIFNGTGYSQNVFLPWENKDVEGWNWKSTPATCIRVNADYSTWDPDKTMGVTVKAGESDIIEKYKFKHTDGTKIEFRIPLEKIGLNGENKEIKFAVSSGIYEDNKNIDWIPHGGPIIDTTGPIFGGFTPIIALSGFLVVGLIAKKKKSDLGEYL